MHTIDRKWHEFDAKDKVLGRLVTDVALLLAGRRKVGWRPNVDNGDHVVITNCAAIAVTGNKEEAKMYHRHSGYPGGITSLNLGELREKDAAMILKHAVKGMLPKNRLASDMMKRLHVYNRAEHKHQTIHVKHD